MPKLPVVHGASMNMRGINLVSGLTILAFAAWQFAQRLLPRIPWTIAKRLHRC